MTTPTAAELVEAVTPILPLLDIIKIRVEPMTDSYVNLRFLVSTPKRDESLETEYAALLILGALASDCERRGLSFVIEHEENKSVTVAIGNEYEGVAPSKPLVIAACRAMRRAIEASKEQP